MSAIYLDERCTLRKFSASANGTRSTVRLEIECSDGLSLGYLLDELKRVVERQKEQRKPKKAAPLMLEYQPEET